MKNVAELAQELLAEVKFDYEMSFEYWVHESGSINGAVDCITECINSNSVVCLYRVYDSVNCLDETIQMLDDMATRLANEYDMQGAVQFMIDRDLHSVVRSLMIQAELCKLGCDLYKFEDQGWNGMYIFIEPADESKGFAIGVESGSEALALIQGIGLGLSSREEVAV